MDNKKLKIFFETYKTAGIIALISTSAGILLGLIFSLLILTGYERAIPNSAVDEAINEQEPVQKTDEQEEVFYRFIDGMKVDDEESAELAPFAVVITNGSDARPASGLSKAVLVYEALVEGGVTRFFTVFDQKTSVEKIGPVRSARDYFVDLAGELNVIFAHAGGSPSALAMLKGNKKLINLDEISPDGIYFWRGNSGFPPNNLYTSTDNLNRAFEIKNVQNPLSFGKEKAWQFKDDIVLEERPEAPIALLINYSQFNYQVKFEYNRDGNEYVRYQAGDKHITEDGSEIKAKNVVVRFVETFLIDPLRLGITLESDEGQAVVCIDGTCREALWRNSGNGERTRYYYQDKDLGEREVLFNRGMTWISLFPKGRESDVSF